MSTILISSLPEATALNSGDWLVKDTGTATNKISAANACATANQPGLVSTSAQTIAGEKTFTSPIKLTDGTKTITLSVNNSVVTVSAGTNITIVTQGVVRNGNSVSGYIRFTASAQIDAYAYILNGLPAAATSAVFPLLTQYNGLITSPSLYMDIHNTGLRVGSENMAAGTYNVYFNYICE